MALLSVKATEKYGRVVAKLRFNRTIRLEGWKDEDTVRHLVTLSFKELETYCIVTQRPYFGKPRAEDTPFIDVAEHDNLGNLERVSLLDVRTEKFINLRRPTLDVLQSYVYPYIIAMDDILDQLHQDGCVPSLVADTPEAMKELKDDIANVLELYEPDSQRKLKRGLQVFGIHASLTGEILARSREILRDPENITNHLDSFLFGEWVDEWASKSPFNQ